MQACLIKRLTLVSKRMIHVNLHITVFIALLVNETHIALIVAWNIRAAKDFVSKILEENRERPIASLRAKAELVPFPVDRYLIRGSENEIEIRGQKIGSQRLAVAFILEPNVRGRDFDTLLARGAGDLRKIFGDSRQTDAFRRGIRIAAVRWD